MDTNDGYYDFMVFHWDPVAAVRWPENLWKETVKTSDHQMKINDKEDPETSNYGYIIWI